MVKNMVGMVTKIIIKQNNMDTLFFYVRSVLVLSIIFHAVSSIVWLTLGVAEKSMNRGDMAVIFFVLYVIVRKIETLK